MQLEQQLPQSQPKIIINYTNYVSIFQLNLNQNPFTKSTVPPTLPKLKQNQSMINLAEKSEKLDSISADSQHYLQQKAFTPKPKQQQSSETQSKQSKSFLLIYSFLLFSGIGAIFTISCYYPLLSLLIPQGNANPLLEFFRNDEYYCYLFPLMLPLSVLILYMNWVCLKFFRHS